MVSTDTKETDINYRCNLFGLPLPACQAVGTAAGFTAFYSFGALFTQTLSSYVGSQVPTLEKQFGLTSYESGIVMTFNDIGFLACILFVSTIPKLVNIPKWLFGTMVLFAISGLLCALPHFLFFFKSEFIVPDTHDIAISNLSQPVKTATNDFFLCTEKINSSAPITESIKHHRDMSNITSSAKQLTDSKVTTKDSVDFSVKQISLTIIAIGMILQGVAKAPRSPFTTVYLDDGCDRRKTGFYLGIIIGCSIFGPALSYGLGGLFSRLYVTLEDVDMSPRDPRWIGAWWLGFIVFGGLTLLASLPMLCFPRYLADKKSANLAQKELTEKDVKSRDEIKISKTKRFKERALSYLRVLQSPVFVCVLVSNLFGFSAIIGKIVFLSKYVAAQFGVPLWQANIIVSASNLITVSIGSIVSGTITRKIPMSPRRCFQVITALSLVTFTFACAEIFIGCEQPDILGPSSLSSNINTNNSCSCDFNDFFPVCGTDGRTYHSPCYAGCSNALRGGRSFTNCSSIPEGKASPGLCPFDCDKLLPFVAMNVISSFVGSLGIMPSVIGKMRSVQDRDKGTSMGLESTLGSLIVAVPVPILFGRIIDTTCLIWGSRQGQKANCSLYNIDDFRFRMLGTALLYRIGQMVFVFIALKLCWNIHKWEDLWKGKSSQEKDEEVVLVQKCHADTEKMSPTE